jgi:hypothetical protein
MNRTRSILLAAFVLVCCSLGSKASAQTPLTAAEIIARSAKAEGVTRANSASSRNEATVTSGGVTYYVTALSKAPNKVLVRTYYPQRNLTIFEGYDGHTAWRSSLPGASGPPGPEALRIIRSSAAFYNNALYFPERWRVRATRLPDVMLQGKTYYAVREEPDGGKPDILFFDRRTFQVAGAKFDSAHYELCTRSIRRHGTHVCSEQTQFDDADRVVSSLVFGHPDDSGIADWQFTAPTDLLDSTTAPLLDNYAAAIHADRLSSTATLHGHSTFTRRSDGHRSPAYEWSLRLDRPMAFLLHRMHNDQLDFTSAFDGATGFSQYYDKPKLPQTFATSISAMAYNHCELNRAQCGVTVTRIANQTIDGQLCYALKVTSTANPSRWYTVLLDSRTYLPSALSISGAQLVRLSDYRADATGAISASTWAYDYRDGVETITWKRP